MLMPGMLHPPRERRGHKCHLRDVPPPPPAEEPPAAPGRVKKDGVKKVEKGFWAGDGVMIEENVVKRVKINIFGDVLHQLFGVATDEELQQQLRVDEEL